LPDRRITDPSDYEVGYGRPPKATQFIAGRSGNPKGRPKGARSVGAVLRTILRQRIAVTENGKTRRIPALEVMLRRLANDAMRSDPRAMKLLFAMVEQYSDSSETAIRLSDVLAEDQEILARYLQEPPDLAQGDVAQHGEGEGAGGL
jgi:hypothetical protein